MRLKNGIKVSLTQRHKTLLGRYDTVSLDFDNFLIFAAHGTAGQYDDSYCASLAWISTMLALSCQHQIFTERVKAAFEGVPNVEIIVRDEGIFLL